MKFLNYFFLDRRKSVFMFIEQDKRAEFTMHICSFLFRNYAYYFNNQEVAYEGHKYTDFY